MSFGEELKRERELREITLREVAEATKISLRHLAALERNEFESLPGGVFNRGFVRAYSQFIGVDPEDMVNAYLLQERSPTGELPQGSLMRRSSSRPRPEGQGEQPESAPASRRGLLRLGLLVLLIVVVAAGIYFAIRLLGPATGDGASGLGARPSAAGEGTGASRMLSGELGGE